MMKVMALAAAGVDDGSGESLARRVAADLQAITA